MTTPTTCWRQVLPGDRETVELRSKTRAWVIAGQRKTLARLGVAFDRVFFESDFLADAAELSASGLRDGTLQRREDGVVVYPSGIDGFEEFPPSPRRRDHAAHARAGLLDGGALTSAR